MASLEQLLADDGFKKKGRMKGGSRYLHPVRAVSMPLYTDRQPLRPPRPADSKLTHGRTQSHVYHRRSEPVSTRTVGSSRLGRRASMERDDESQTTTEDYESRSPDRRVQSWELGSVGEIEEERTVNEIEEVDESGEREESQRYKKYMNSLFEDGGGRSRKLERRPSFSNDNRSNKKADPKNLAIDEAAIQAVISIVSGYARRFFKDENYRGSILRGCHSCLGINGSGESQQRSGAISNLREAISTVQKAAEETPDPIELRKASLKLSVITGLSSKYLKDGYSSGIPNSDLAACAHIYLAMIYKLQRKERVAAKHLLQVFCESSCQARTVLLPGLWDHLFFPHLSHFKLWYERAAETIPGTQVGLKKMKLLDKVYSNALDMGTYQFAVYYKKWLMEENEAPELPSVQVPSAYLHGVPQEDLDSSIGISNSFDSSSSRSIVSKKLYDSLFSNSNKMEIGNRARSRVEKSAEEEEEVEVVRLIVRRGSSLKPVQEYKEKSTSSSKPGMSRELIVEDDSEFYQNMDESPDASEETIDDSNGPETTEVEELQARSRNTSSRPAISGSRPGSKTDVQAKQNELTLTKLAQAAFKPQQEEDLYNNVHPSNIRRSKTKLKGNGTISTSLDLSSSVLSPIAEPSGVFEGINQGSLFSKTPKGFICPITALLFKDPVTLETGQTFERAAIKEWFDKGNTTCPVTRRELEFLSVPVTNFVLKRVIDGWKSEYCRDLLIFALQVAGNTVSDDPKSKDASALYIIQQLLTGLNIEGQMENAKHLVSLGGLHFLLLRLELGDLEEKTRVVSLLLRCIKAEGSCRSYLAMNIGMPCILELLHSKQISSRTHAVSLLIELICLNRRTAITSFLRGLKTETIMNTMHLLLVYLQSSLPEQRVLVAVLLLNLDLMVEPRRYSIYREEAANSIILALNCCLSDEKIVPNTRRALLMLGGHFSSFGETLTESWLLKQAGFYSGSGVAVDYEDEVDEIVLGEEEAKEREEWLKNVAMVLLGNGKRSFIETLSDCLRSENLELVSACLTTVAWLSSELAFLAVPDIQLTAFSTLIPQLKECLASDKLIEQRVLTSLSLLNFSKITGMQASN